MQANEIQGALARMDAAMRVKGIIQPRACLVVDGQSYPQVMLQRNPNDTIHETIKFIGAEEDTVDDVLAKSDAYVQRMPTKERLQFDEFMKALGACIEKGKKLGIEVDINPLIALVESLSKNALEDRRER